MIFLLTKKQFPIRQKRNLAVFRRLSAEETAASQ